MNIQKTPPNRIYTPRRIQDVSEPAIWRKYVDLPAVESEDPLGPLPGESVPHFDVEVQDGE